MSNIISEIKRLFTRTGDKYHVNVTADAAEKLETARTINGISFDGSNNVLHFAVCSTAAATVAKTISVTNYKLAAGSKVSVQFTNGNSVNNPTLNVSSTGAKPIKIGNSNIANGYIQAGLVYQLVYDGSAYQISNPLTHGIDNIPYVICNGTLQPLEKYAVLKS